MAPVSAPRILTAAGVTLDTLEPSVNKAKFTSLFVMLLNFSYGYGVYGNTATVTVSYCPCVA